MNSLQTTELEHVSKILSNFEDIGKIVKIEYDQGDGDEDYYKVLTNQGSYLLHATDEFPPREGVIRSTDKGLRFNVNYKKDGGSYVRFVKVIKNTVNDDVILQTVPDDEREYYKQYVQDLALSGTPGFYALLAEVS